MTDTSAVKRGILRCEKDSRVPLVFTSALSISDHTLTTWSLSHLVIRYYNHYKEELIISRCLHTTIPNKTWNQLINNAKY